MADYYPDVDYKLEGLDPEIEAVNDEEEKATSRWDIASEDNEVQDHRNG